MYDSVAGFLRSFSSSFPLLWVMLVMVVITGASVALYVLWELILRWVPRVFNSSARKN